MRLADHLDAFSTKVEKVAGLFLGVITVVVFVSAVGRYLFAWPIPDSFDVSRFLLGIAIMWGFASVGYRGTHIKVDLIADMLPERMRRWVDLFAWSVLLLFAVLLAWKMFGRVESTFSSGEATFDLRIPAWPFLGLIWLGAVVSVLTILARMILMLLQPERRLEAFEQIDQDRPVA